MKYFLLLVLTALFLTGCGGSGPQIENQVGGNRPANTPKDELSAISHSAEKTFPSSTPGNSPAASNSGGTPMSQAIDVSAMNAEIQKAEKKYEKDKNDAQVKKDLAHAYFVRAFALTEAAQYRAALGDFRRGLKLDPNDEDAQKMHDQIISIFKSIGREPPKEGEEPPPLPFDKEAPAKP